MIVGAAFRSCTAERDILEKEEILSEGSSACQSDYESKRTGYALPVQRAGLMKVSFLGFAYEGPPEALAHEFD